MAFSLWLLNQSNSPVRLDLLSFRRKSTTQLRVVLRVISIRQAFFRSVRFWLWSSSGRLSCDHSSECRSLLRSSAGPFISEAWAPVRAASCYFDECSFRDYSGSSTFWASIYTSAMSAMDRIVSLAFPLITTSIRRPDIMPFAAQQCLTTLLDFR